MPNLLFICSKNQWRSPTAELLFKNHHNHCAQSSGTSDKARIKVNEALINWADVVFVMERRHKAILAQRFPETIPGKTLVVLNIADEYQFNDPELIELLKAELTEYL